MAELDNIRAHFRQDGYREIPSTSFSKKLLWQPNLIFVKDNYTYLVLVKSNNTIPPAYLSRIAKTPGDAFVPLVLFGEKISSPTEKEISSFGISYGYFKHGKVSGLTIKKRRPNAIIKKEIRRKLTVIDIFISSRQDIPEREFIKDRIEYLRKANSYPFGPPCLIEYDNFPLKSVYRHIDKKMSNCEWIIITLEETFSKYVRYEINKAIKIIDHKNVFIFVKNTAKCKTVWKKELTRIEHLPDQTIKYLPFNDKSDLEVSLTKAIRSRMTAIQKQKKIEIYAD